MRRTSSLADLGLRRERGDAGNSTHELRCDEGYVGSDCRDSQTFQHISGRRKLEIPQQPTQPLLAPAQIRIVAKRGQPARADAGLLRIDFPRMQVKDERLPFQTIDPGQREAG